MRRKLRTLEALLLLCLWAVAIRLLPVRYLLPVGRQPFKVPDYRTECDRHADNKPKTGGDAALAIRGAIRSASARLPFKPSCLVQSLAAVFMLRRRGLAHHLHIGARMDPDFQAHAWVEAAGLVIAGEGDVGSYSVLLTRER